HEGPSLSTMAIQEIVDGVNLRDQQAPTPALPGSSSLQKVKGVPTMVDDQGASTPIASILTVADVTALAALATLNKIPTGQTVLATSAGPYGTVEYIMTAAIGTADAINIVATSDDVTRQWVRKGLLSGPATFISDEIDLTAISSVQFAPAVTGRRLARPANTSCNFLVTVAAGTALSSAATARVGSDVGHSNLKGSSSLIFTSANWTTGVGNIITGVGPTTFVYPVNAAGVFDVTAAATGTGPFAFKARLVTQLNYVPT
ncbi:MAG: hypothetical protein JWM82_3130, partial [Myxococcales bacterium]|nr:hypothetical protein [Myxococcales bacterium]